MKKEIEKFADKLVNAYKKNKLISPLPIKYTKNIKNATKLRKLCESKVNAEIVGFKAGGTGFPVLKKLKEKEPFYASVYKHNFLRSGKKVKINNYTLGMELEVCYLIKKKFFSSNKNVSKNNKNGLELKYCKHFHTAGISDSILFFESESYGVHHLFT